MKRMLWLQLQPDLLSVEVDKVKDRIESLKDSPLVEKMEFSTGEDDGPYMNFAFYTSNVVELWEMMDGLMAPSDALGNQLARSSMVMCQLLPEADNFALLHHYNAEVEVDELSDWPEYFGRKA